MKKKAKAAILTLTVTAIIAGIFIVWFLQNAEPKTREQHAAENQSETSETGVTIDIKTRREVIPEYKEVVDEETGEKIMAEVQVNEPIEPKSTTPPEKPVAAGDYTNPEAPPAYTEKQTKVEEKPKSTVNNSSSSNASSGKVYVEGFGYVEKAGETRIQTGVSDGDINKMVGSMD